MSHSTDNENVIFETYLNKETTTNEIGILP